MTRLLKDLIVGTLLAVVLSCIVAYLFNLDARPVAAGAVVGTVVTHIGMTVIDVLVERYRKSK